MEVWVVTIENTGDVIVAVLVIPEGKGGERGEGCRNTVGMSQCAYVALDDGAALPSVVAKLACGYGSSPPSVQCFLWADRWRNLR